MITVTYVNHNGEELVANIEQEDFTVSTLGVSYPIGLERDLLIRWSQVTALEAPHDTMVSLQGLSMFNGSPPPDGGVIE